MKEKDSVNLMRAGSVMNLPIKVFSNMADIDNYFKTGNAINVFSSGVCILCSSPCSFHVDIQKINDCQVGESLSLPNGTQKKLWGTLSGAKDVKTFMSAVDSCGMDITYSVPYKLGHYTQKYSADGTYT